MRHVMMLLTILIFQSIYSTCATAYNDEMTASLTILVSLREARAASKFTDEYRSIEEAYAHAEQCLENDDAETAKVYFSLVRMKGRLLEEKLLAVNSSKPWNTQAIELPSVGVVASSSESNDSPDTGTVVAQAAPAQPIEGAGFVGGETEYTVKKRESVRLVGAKLGVDWRRLAAENGIDPKKPLSPGMKLKVNNRKIVPKEVQEGLIINIPDRTMYLFQRGELVKALPVAVGKPKTKSLKSDFVWHTPTGRFRIVEKKKDPVWRVPLSIQREMELVGKEVVTEVAAGAGNPLGRYAIRTSIPGILIHSTSNPSSIYTFSSHGCIRVYPDHMKDLFREVKISMPGEIIYRPVKVGVSNQGRVYLEVHRDIYEKGTDISREARNLIERNKLTDKVDWSKVEVVLKRKAGVAEDVTL